MKKWVFGLIITTISLGLIVPFFSETICTIFVPDISIGLNTWNQFVGIILGVVATILSIVSLIMGFKNYEDGLDLHEKNIETLEKITYILQDVHDVKTKLESITILSDSKNEARKMPLEMPWNKDPENKL